MALSASWWELQIKMEALVFCIGTFGFLALRAW